jgi:ribonuclease D
MPPARSWAERNPDADARLKAARTSIAAISEDMAIPAENLLTPDLLRRVAWNPPEPVTTESIGDALEALSARPWQIEATAQAIASAFVESSQLAPDAPKPES